MKSPRLYLRALEPADYEKSILWRKDEELWAFLGGAKYFVSKEYEKQWVLNKIHDRDQITLAICEHKTDNYIGNVYLTDFNWINRSCQSHILIGEKSTWGKGYGTEATNLLLEFAFMERNINRVEAYILEQNFASRKVHEKCGYRLEGILRNKIYKNGAYHNQCIFSILKTEYRKEQK